MNEEKQYARWKAVFFDEMVTMFIKEYKEQFETQCRTVYDETYAKSHIEMTPTWESVEKGFKK